MLRFWLLRHAVDRRLFRQFGIASAAGGLIGALLHASASSRSLAMLFGALLVFAGVSQTSGLAERWRFPRSIASLAGAVSGMFGGLVGNQCGIRAAGSERGIPSYQELLYEARRFELDVDVSVEVASDEDIQRFAHLRRTGVAPEIRITKQVRPPEKPPAPDDSNAVEPGWVATKMGGPGAPDDLALAPVTQAWLAVSDDPAATDTDGYFYHQQPRPAHPAARDPAFQDELLDYCSSLTGTPLTSPGTQTDGSRPPL